MLSNVPQFIDIEDKVAGPLTAKQVFWLVGMGGVLFLIWTVFDSQTFFILGIPTILIFSVFAFYRPYNQSFLSFMIHSLLFLFRPKVYTWERPLSLKKNLESSPNNSFNDAPKENTGTKNATPKTFQELASLVDRKKID